MEFISIIDANNEYFFNENKIEWHENIKINGRYISTFIINDSINVVSTMKVKYKCENCGVDVVQMLHNFKKRKSNKCISCIRKYTVKKIHRDRTEEERTTINKKISENTKKAMSSFSKEKKKEMYKKMKESLDWDKRNRNWLKTMNSKSEEEKKEISKKVSEALRNKSEEEKLKWRNNVKKTWLKKYGVEHISQNSEILEKQMRARKDSWKLKDYESKFGPLTYQTKPELEFIKFCETNNIFVKDGPLIDYSINNKHYKYKIDFETENFLIEIKNSHCWYFEDLKNGIIDVKNEAAQEYAASINKNFLFLLDIKEFSKFNLH